MTLPLDREVVPVDGAPHFGHGGGRPYEAALVTDRPTVLRLRPATPSGTSPAGGGSGAHATGHAGDRVEVARFLAAPDAADRLVLRRTAGPVLDVGCGPGRMVAESRRRGRVALGIDVSAAAVGIARAAGIPVLLRSVFDPLPGEGIWGTTLLLDGNIGIGGDPPALLARCASLTAPGGTVVVEAHPETGRHARFHAELVDEQGTTSAAFPWAQVGSRALVELAAGAGLGPARTVVRGHRRFVLLDRGGLP
ncbi:methyltransferase domain-containing protein [Terrabacter sp. NPDC000476]|uniref:methyltransferase domain-containing protein n=1 Tax=Terrabacter sp. NPDC000476 TaxID=3154258 RepID=UPI003318954B